MRSKQIYQKLYKEHGYSYRSLHWSSEAAQKKRFEMFLDFNLKNTSLLDLGCGFGDLYKFLMDKKIPCSYTGYDEVEEFILFAKKQYGGNFFCKSLQEGESFDYIVASGLFAFGDRNFFLSSLRHMRSASKKGFAFNIYHPTYDDRFLRISVDEVLDFLKRLNSKKIIIRDDYLENDTTFFIYV